MKFRLGRMETPLTPWVFALPTCPWIGRRMVLRIKICPSRLWMPLKRIFIGLKRVRVLRLRRRELLNLESSINYGNARALPKRRKGKAQVL